MLLHALISDGSGVPAERASTELAMAGLGCRFAAVVRVVVVTAASLATLFGERSRAPAATLAVIVGVIAWNAAYCWLLYFRYARAGRRSVPLDVAVVCTVCLAQLWTSPAEMNFDGMTWAYAVAAIVVVTYQFYSGLTAGAAVTVLVVAAYLVGIAVAAPRTWHVEAPFALWMVAEALLARAVRTVVWREGRIIDRLLAQAERTRHDAEVAQARRNAEQAYLAALHDTASATLLMVGAGVASGRQPWLAEQARRDLDVIQGRTVGPAGEVELIGMLREVARLTPLRVTWHTCAELRVPGRVAEVLCGATREVLTNVVRHAGVPEAEITVHSGPSLVVEITDRGRGFSPAAVPVHRFGATGSLDGRLTGVGGSAAIDSRPGRGTRVRLEVPVDAGTRAGPG
jgi:hypothetical protein